MEISIDGGDAIFSALLVTSSTLYIFFSQPATRENANRSALHELEAFCPPKWNSMSATESNLALSNLYKELQYASRGNSFIITRAAAWEMKKILQSNPNPDGRLSEEESQQLYVWKTLIAFLLRKKSAFPSIAWSHRRFKARLSKAIAHTKWVIYAYDHMNGTSLKNFFPLLKAFEDKLRKFQNLHKIGSLI